MQPRPTPRAGQGHRRRRSPAEAAARRHTRWLVAQLRRAGAAVRTLPARLRAHGGVRAALAEARRRVAERGRALGPAASRAVAGLGDGLGRSTSGLGRAAALGGRGLAVTGRLAARGGRRIVALLRTAGRAVLLALRALAEAIGRFTVAAGEGLWRRRAVLGAIALRALWWGALALLIVGGRAITDVRAPLLAAALPFFVAGLALCLPLLFARAARLRWAGFALALGHAALAAIVWTAGATA